MVGEKKGIMHIVIVIYLHEKEGLDKIGYTGSRLTPRPMFM